MKLMEFIEEVQEHFANLQWKRVQQDAEWLLPTWQEGIETVLNWTDVYPSSIPKWVDQLHLTLHKVRKWKILTFRLIGYKSNH